MSAVDQKLVLASEPKRAIWSLEMDRAGIQLKLESAMFDSFLLVSNLKVLVPYAGKSFDYTAGPKVLQSSLTFLENVEIHLSLPDLVKRNRVERDWNINQIRALHQGLSLAGTGMGVPFTLGVQIASGAFPGSVRLGFVKPRFWGFVPDDWDYLPTRIIAGINPALRLDFGDDWVEIGLLRLLLIRLITGLGYKMPILDGIGLTSWRHEDGRLILSFGRLVQDESASKQPDRKPLQNTPESTARACLQELTTGGHNQAVVERFLRSGVAAPRFATEVISRALILGQDRPESVLPHLVIMVLADAGKQSHSLLNNLSKDQILHNTKRLLAAVELEGDPSQLFLAAQLVAKVSLGMDPDYALKMLEEVRYRGIETTLVLQSLSLALDRTGQHEEARVVRSRALALVPTGQTAKTLVLITEQLESFGLTEVALQWLLDVIDQCDQGFYGSESKSIKNKATLMLAARESLDTQLIGQARGRLLGLLDENSLDEEALNLLLATSSGSRQVAEAISRFKEAANAAHGMQRAGFLLEAASATLDRLGLKHQAIELLEQSLEAAAENQASMVALDRLYNDLGYEERRLALILKRIELPCTPNELDELRFEGARLAFDSGATDTAAQLLTALLEGDPTHVSGLELALEVAISIKDNDWAKRISNTLSDLGHKPDFNATGQPNKTAVAVQKPVTRDNLEDDSDGMEFEPSFSEEEDVEDPDDIALLDADSEELDLFEAEAQWLNQQMEIGAEQLLLGNPMEALSAALEVLEVDPVHLEALRLSVQAAVAVGDLDLAVQLGRRWVDRIFTPSQQVLALLELADIQLLSSEDPSDAVASYARVMSTIPCHQETLATVLNLAKLHPSDASKILLPVVASAVSTAMDLETEERNRCADRLYEIAGAVWDDLELPETALSILELIIGLAPDHEAATSDLIILYQALGRLAAADVLQQM